MRCGRVLGAGLVAAVGLVGGCADEAERDPLDLGALRELTAREQEYADAFAANFAAEAESGFDLDEASAACMGDALVRELGVAPFEAAGVEPAELEESDEPPGVLLGAGVVTEDQVVAVAEAWDGCEFNEAFATVFNAEFPVDEPASECLEQAIDAGFRERFVRAALTATDDRPLEDAAFELIELSTGCTGLEDSFFVASLAEGFQSDGILDEEQAHCVAVETLETMGIERFLELTRGSGELEDAPEDVHGEVMRAVLDATGACGIPLSQLSGL